MEDKKKKVVQPAGGPDPVIIHNIEIRPWNRTEQNIPNWRRAVQSAESQIPRRVMLYNLYADVDLDGHVESVTGKRRDHVKAANWQFVDKEGKAVDDVNDLIDTIGFDDMLEEIVNARFWGYSIMEPTFWKGQDGQWQMDEGLIPRLNYRPELGIVAKEIYGNEGINIREGIYAKTVMEIGKVTDLGLYMKAAPYQILKRGGIGDYAAFIQTFGNPIIDATWDGVDETQRVALSKSLNSLGAGGALIRPAGTTVEIKENNVNTTGDAHGSFANLMNREISKALLGTTETTESSSSSGYAQSETHSDEDDVKHENDISYCRKSLNSRFIPLMQAAGIDTKGGRFIIQGENTELSKEESFKIHKELAIELNLPIEDDYWYETYGVPKPKNYDQLKADKLAAKETEPQPPTKEVGEKPDPKKKEEEDPEKGKVVQLFDALKSFFLKAPAVTTGAMTTCGHHHTIKLAETDLINNDALIQRIWDKEGKATFDRELFWQTAEVLIKGFKKGWDTSNTVNLVEAPGFVYGKDDPAMLTAFEQNLFRFSGAKTLAEAHALNKLFRQTTSFAEFYELATQRVDVFNRDWLETEYNTSVLTGQAAATYHRLMAQTDIFPYWEYRTAGDHLVRPAHALLDGLILPANDPRWKWIFPPNGWNCRCYIVPRMAHEFNESDLKKMQEIADHYLDSPQFASEKAQGWGVNRAASGEIFTANQQYANKFPGKAAKKLDSLSPQDWGLQSYSNAKKVGKDNAPLYKDDAKDFYDSLEEAKGVKITTDYHNRPLQALKNAFIGKSAKNADLVRSMQETMQQPDEVWLNGKDLENLTYIKYYADRTVVVRGSIQGSAIKLVDWFQLEEKKSVLDTIRKGLLILSRN